MLSNRQCKNKEEQFVPACRKRTVFLCFYRANARQASGFAASLHCRLQREDHSTLLAGKGLFFLCFYRANARQARGYASSVHCRLQREDHSTEKSPPAKTVKKWKRNSQKRLKPTTKRLTNGYHNYIIIL